MKILIHQQLNNSPRNLIRRCGYAEITDRLRGKVSYVRRLGKDFYPRFHAYVEEMGKGAQVDLHIDMKKASYEGVTRHSGEYEGPLIEKEAQRIQDIFINYKI